MTLIVWDATDERNQQDMAHFTRIIGSGETADLTVGLSIDPCVRYQRDLYLDLPKAERYTLSDVSNYLLAAPGVFWGPLTSCRNPSPTPVSPVVTPPVVTPICRGCAPGVPQPIPPPPPPVCVSPGTFTFPSGSFIARFPAGFPAPWYPEEIGPFSFSVPSGVWHVMAVTGDSHSIKNDGTQAHEIGAFVLSSGQVVGPTLDIPDNIDVQITDFGSITISGFNGFRFVHAGPMNPVFPTDSFFPMSITFACE